MKPERLLCLALVLFGLSSQARLIRPWSEAELLQASDLVVVGRPVKVKDLDEMDSLGWPQYGSYHPRFRGVETTFKVSGVRKGTPLTDQIVLHHYRFEHENPPNGPTFISFTPNSTNEYVLYLKNDGTNRYTPVAGQIDAGLSIKSAPDRSQLDQDAAAKRYFEHYLANCDTNAINCLWFLQNQPGIGMVMTIHLDQETVFTVRDVYNWALQGGDGTRRLTHSQVLTLKQIIGNLPASDKNADFNKSVFISIRNGEKVEVFQYDRRHAPAIVQRIYDIGGGYLETNIVAP